MKGLDENRGERSLDGAAMATIAAPAGERHRIRNIVGGSAGNMVEWYDWYIYAAFSLYFAPSLFPPGGTVGQLSGAALIFWAGFLMRPVGAWIMGV